MRLTRKQKATGLVAGGAAALALLGGAAATFTDSATAPAQNIASGTIDITLDDPAEFTQSIENLADNDTFTRTVTVQNSGTIAFGGPIVMSAVHGETVYTAAAEAKDAAHVAGSVAGTLPNGVALELMDATDLRIDADYSNADYFDAVVFNDSMKALNLSQDVLLQPLAAGESVDLTFTYTLDVDGWISDSPALNGANGAILGEESQQAVVNAFQGLSDTITYTFTAQQRDAGVYNDVSPDGSFDGDPATAGQ